MTYLLRCTYSFITRQVVDPDQKHFRSFITLWDVMEPDTKPSHASVPLRSNTQFSVSQYVSTVCKRARLFKELWIKKNFLSLFYELQPNVFISCASLITVCCRIILKLSTFNHKNLKKFTPFFHFLGTTLLYQIRIQESLINAYPYLKHYHERKIWLGRLNLKAG